MPRGNVDITDTLPDGLNSWFSYQKKKKKGLLQITLSVREIQVNPGKNKLFGSGKYNILVI